MGPPTASSWSLGPGGYGCRAGAVGGDETTTGHPGPTVAEDGLRKDRKSLPKLALEQNQIRNLAMVSERLEKWIYGLQLAIATWSSNASVHF